MARRAVSGWRVLSLRRPWRTGLGWVRRVQVGRELAVGDAARVGAHAAVRPSRASVAVAGAVELLGAVGGRSGDGGSRQRAARLRPTL